MSNSGFVFIIDFHYLSSSETSVLVGAARRSIPEDGSLQILQYSWGWFQAYLTAQVMFVSSGKLTARDMGR
jgi:hypothetical protein